MGATTVVNISKASLNASGYENLLHWLENPEHIYIGRHVRYVQGAAKSKWANPFGKKKYGHKKCVEMYESYILDQPELLASLHELKGKTLGCWCKPSVCHGDILIRLIEERLESNSSQ